MDKIAELSRNAEVRGALTAFVHKGHVKVASNQAFEDLVSEVCTGLGEDLNYDLQKVAEVTDAILSGATGQQVKEAAEAPQMSVREALGDLVLQKVAGQIDDDAFASETSTILKEAGFGALLGSALRNASGKASAGAASFKDVLSGKGVQAAKTKYNDAMANALTGPGDDLVRKELKNKVLTERLKRVGAGTVAAAPLAGAYYAGKASGSDR